MTDRPSARQRGYGTKWQKERAAHLLANPWCAKCAGRGLQTPATVVDHIKPHRGDDKLFWSRSNWQSLCEADHNGGKQREDNRGYSGEVGPDGWPLDPRHPGLRG